MEEIKVVLVYGGVILFIIYFIIKLAVNHAIDESILKDFIDKKSKESNQ